MGIDLWGELAIAGAIVAAVWRLDGHFITRREFLLYIDLLRKDMAVLQERLGCDKREDNL